MNPSFLTGFIKRAADYGINQQESLELCKRAFPEELQHLMAQLQNPEVSHGLIGAGAGAGVGALAAGKGNRLAGAAIGGSAGGIGGAYEGGHQDQMHNWMTLLKEKGSQGLKGAKDKAEHFMNGNEKGIPASAGVDGVEGYKNLGEKSSDAFKNLKSPFGLSEKDFNPVAERDIPFTDGGNTYNHHVAARGGLDIARNPSFNLGDVSQMPHPQPSADISTLLSILAGKKQLD